MKSIACSVYEASLTIDSHPRDGPVAAHTSRTYQRTRRGLDQPFDVMSHALQGTYTQHHGVTSKIYPVTTIPQGPLSSTASRSTDSEMTRTANACPPQTFMYNNVLRQCTRLLCRLPAYSHCLPRSIHVAQDDAFTSHDSTGLLLAINSSNDSGALWGGWMVLRNLIYCKYRAVAFREKQEYIAGVSRELSPVLNGNIYQNV